MGLHERAQSVYNSSNLQLKAELINTSDVEKAFDKAVSHIHAHKTFVPGMLTDKPILKLIDATVKLLSQGIEKGVANAEPDDALIQSLKESAGVFGGFKTFHEMSEAAALLVDEKGFLKPFKQFLNDVQTINKTYNVDYLRTEYEFAVSSASMAAKWETQKDAEGRYLLQYRTAGDNKVRKEHRDLNGITLPASDPFWDKYYPPNGWNCRCSVTKVRTSKYPMTDPAQAMKLGDKVTNGKHAQMFRFNPGKQRAAYPAYNTYTIKKCAICDKNTTLKFNIPDNQLCQACPIIHKCIGELFNE